MLLACVIILAVADLKSKIDELAKLMKEFGLERARLVDEDVSIEFATSAPTSRRSQNETDPAYGDASAPVSVPQAAEIPAVPTGTPVSSPMMGVFYSSPSPGNPPFVNEGDAVIAGQVVGLIEAMKVFNEITSPVSGTVSKVVADSGKLVQPGEPLLYIS